MNEELSYKTYKNGYIKFLEWLGEKRPKEKEIKEAYKEFKKHETYNRKES